MIVNNYKLFGGSVEFSLDADETISTLIMEDAYKLAIKLQKIFNIYDNGSEISNLNRKRELTISAPLLEVLKRALELCEESKGEYDITHGKLFIDRKSSIKLDINDTNSATVEDEAKRVKSSYETKISCSYKDVSIKGNHVILSNENILLDLGSIAKGYIAEQIAMYFIEQGIESGYIDARGDIRVFGDETVVDIQNPRGEGIICQIRVKNKGIATSGDYAQYQKDFSKSHIIRQKNIISVTIIADNLEDADAFATMAMVCSNPDELFLKHEIQAMTIDNNLNIKYYNGFEKLIT